MKRLTKFSDRRVSFLVGLLLFGVILLIFLPLVLFSMLQVIRNGEILSTQSEVERVETILRDELEELDLLTHSTASRDETYAFAQNLNPVFIEGNLSETSSGIGETDFFVALDPSNRVKYAYEFGQSEAAAAALSLQVADLIQTYPVLLKFDSPDSGKAGLIEAGGRPILVSAWPILTSQGEGPARGTLILGRYLDGNAIDDISQMTQRTIRILADSQIRKVYPWLQLARGANGQIMVEQPNAEISLGYKTITDLNSQGDLVLFLENPRNIYRQGSNSALILAVSFLALALLLAIGTYYFTLYIFKTRRVGQRYLERFQMAVDHSRDGILLVTRDFRVLQVNPASRSLLGLQSGQTQSGFLKSLLAFQPELTEAGLLELCSTGGICEHHCTRRDGQEFDLEISASLIPEEGLSTINLTLHDVSKRKKDERLAQERSQALAISEERYMLAANGSNDGLWDWNLMSGKVVYSARWKAMLGYAEEELSQDPGEWFSRVHPDDLVLLRTQLSEHLRRRSEHFECEYRINTRAGKTLWMLARGLAVWDPAGYAHRIAGSQTDITARKALEEQLRYDALHDGLTGMANRALLLDHLKHVNDRKKRKPELIYALFFLDLDRFKQINDTLGHQAGDQLLIDVSRRLDSGLRGVDTVTRFTGAETLARIAGDEFVILLEDFHTPDDALKVADRVVKLLSAPFLVAGREINLSSSLGLVVPEAAYLQVEDIIRDADIAMYHAKQRGGGQVAWFHQSMYDETLEHMQLENELRQALERNEFSVVYQPIYTLENGRITGFEALIRWNHPTRGLLMPKDFIKIAEENGLIVPMGYLVLAESCRKMQEWSASLPGAPELIVSVNFSARQIVSVDLVNHISTILSATGFSPKRLWLEVTESLLVENNTDILDRLRQLRAMGIRIEIDDFGTGYSSLSYLQNLPVDGFKIDRSFVKDIQSDGSQIVKTLIDLGHSLGLTQVAEGVENQQQKDYLSKVSCDYAQGFLMSEPVSAAEVEILIRDQKIMEFLP